MLEVDLTVELPWYLYSIVFFPNTVYDSVYVDADLILRDGLKVVVCPLTSAL